MTLININLGDGIIFKIQGGLSFIQQNEFMAKIEHHIDLEKAQQLIEKQKTTKLDLADYSYILKEGKTVSDLNLALCTYLLLNIVKEPKITREMLEDPEDPNTENFYVLGIRMAEIASEYVGKLISLKKTPKS